MGKFKEDLFIAFCILLMALNGFMILVVDLPFLADLLFLIMYSLIWALFVAWIILKSAISAMEDDK